VRFTLTILLLFIALLTKAQNPHKSPTIGIKGGVHLSSLTGDKLMDTNAKLITPQIGISGAWFFTRRLSVNTEINYEKKGGKFNSYELETNLNYVTVPLFGKYAFSKDPQIYIYGGGYASYLLSATTKGKFEIFEISKDINENIKPNLSAFDFGIVAGVGAQGRFNRRADIFIDLRYCQGLFNVDNNSAEYRYNINDAELDNYYYNVKKGDIYNRSFMLTTGMYFYFIKR